MRAILIAVTTALAASAAAHARAEDAPPREPLVRLHCMSTVESRDIIVGQKLLDPFQCMRETALRHQAEALGARLCRLGDAMLYEVKLLTQSGHVQKVLVDAVSGRPHAGRIEK